MLVVIVEVELFFFLPLPKLRTMLSTKISYIVQSIGEENCAVVGGGYSRVTRTVFYSNVYFLDVTSYVIINTKRNHLGFDYKKTNKIKKVWENKKRSIISVEYS